MDFFESQERAKRNTSRLVAMFVVALLATMASVHVLVTILFAKGNFADVRMLGISLGSVLVVVVIGMAVKACQPSTINMKKARIGAIGFLIDHAEKFIV